jgi:hypothetical protein
MLQVLQSCGLGIVVIQLYRKEVYWVHYCSSRT